MHPVALNQETALNSLLLQPSSARIEKCLSHELRGETDIHLLYVILDPTIVGGLHRNANWVRASFLLEFKKVKIGYIIGLNVSTFEFVQAQNCVLVGRRLDPKDD